MKLETMNVVKIVCKINGDLHLFRNGGWIQLAKRVSSQLHCKLVSSSSESTTTTYSMNNFPITKQSPINLITSFLDAHYIPVLNTIHYYIYLFFIFASYSYFFI